MLPNGSEIYDRCIYTQMQQYFGNTNVGFSKVIIRSTL